MEVQKHILFISSWFPNRNNPTHGIFNLHFAKAAGIKNKVTILHVCFEEKPEQAFELVETNENDIFNVTVYIKKVKNKVPFLSQLIKRKKLIKAFELGFEYLKVKRGVPDLIQLNVVLPAGIGVTHLSEKYRIPYVVNEGWTGYLPEDGNYSQYLQKTLTKKILGNAKIIMPVSKNLEEAMLKHGLSGNYRVVPNVIDTGLFDIQIKKEEPVTSLLHISTLDHKQKNVKGILRAFQMALRTQSDLELTIVGEGPEKATLQQLALQLGIDSKIKFKGTLLSSELIKEFNRCDGLIMFSNYESFCVVVGEALACGKPVITSKAGGLTDMIQPEFGLTVEKRNEEQLTHAILQFSKIKATYKRDILRKCTVDNFSIPVVAEKLDQIYHSALA